MAQAHLREIRAWWVANRPAAPDVLDEELDAALALIAELPLAASTYATISGEQVRRVFLRRSRYAIYYYVRPDAVDVVAVWHSSRGEGPPLR